MSDEKFSIEKLIDILNGVERKNNAEKFILEECSEEEEKEDETIKDTDVFKTLAEILSYELKQ